MGLEESLLMLQELSSPGIDSRGFDTVSLIDSVFRFTFYNHYLGSRVFRQARPTLRTLYRG